MSSMPALRRKTAGAFVMLLCAAPVVKPCLAQPAAPAPNPPPGGVPLSMPPAPTAKPPEATRPPETASPSAPAPRPASGQPDTGPAASPAPGPATPPAAPDTAAPATAAPSTGAQDRAAAVKPAKPEQKSKPGPGANDAGHAADQLRTMKMSLVSLIDRTVIGRDKIVIGRVIDVLVDARGEPAAVVVDAGGILGVGNRRIAIAWERFALAGRKPKDALQLPMTDAQVKSAPAYDGSDTVTVVRGASEPVPADDGKPSDSPPPAAPPAPVPPRQLVADPSRVDLGASPAQPPDDTAPAADPLNPD